MLHSRPRQLAELGDFFTALRINGVPVGPADIDRLRQLFALQPRLDRDGLKHLLSALLVKTPEQREVFEALFADWCPDHDADWPEEAEHTDDTRHRQPTARMSRTQPLPRELDTETALEPPRHRVSRWLFTVGVSVLLCALQTWRFCGVLCARQLWPVSGRWRTTAYAAATTQRNSDGCQDNIPLSRRAPR